MAVKRLTMFACARESADFLLMVESSQIYADPGGARVMHFIPYLSALFAPVVNRRAFVGLIATLVEVLEQYIEYLWKLRT